MVPLSQRSVLSRKELTLLIFILAVTFSLRMVFLHEPLERDEGLYAYIGQEILHGNLPYRDAIDQKPPGIHYIYAAMIMIGGATPESIRVVTAGYAFLTVIAVFFCARKVFGSKAGLWAALCYGIFSSGPLIHGGSSNSEVFMVLPIIVSIYLFVDWIDRQKLVLLAGSGFSLALALIIKTVALPHILAVLVFLAIKDIGNRSIKKMLVDMTVFILPSCLLMVAVASYFYVHDAFADYYYWTVTYNKMYAQMDLIHFFPRMIYQSTLVLPELLPIIILSIPAVYLIFTKLKNYKTIFIASVVPISFIGLSMPTKFFQHYFIQLVPSLAILSGAGMAFIWGKRSKLLYIILPFLIASLFYWGSREYPFYLIYTPEEISAKKYGNADFVDAANVARYIKAHTSPTDYIYQWGFEPEIYFLSGRRAPNPYTFHFAVATSKVPWMSVENLGRSIRTKQPRYIIIQYGRSENIGFDMLKEILSQLYIRENDLSGMQIWRLAGKL